MKTTNSAIQARIDAAAAITWPANTSILINPDPAVRRNLKRVVGLAAALVVCIALASSPNGPIQSLARAMTDRQLRPVMQSAMEHGNKAAGTWLALHYSKDYPGLLEKQAEAGEPAAMFVVGSMLLKMSHPERYIHMADAMDSEQRRDEGRKLIQAAAAAGNLDAVVWVSKDGKP